MRKILLFICILFIFIIPQGSNGSLIGHFSHYGYDYNIIIPESIPDFTDWNIRYQINRGGASILCFTPDEYVYYNVLVERGTIFALWHYDQETVKAWEYKNGVPEPCTYPTRIEKLKLKVFGRN